jgi:hypothetical protein
MSDDVKKSIIDLWLGIENAAIAADVLRFESDPQTILAQLKVIRGQLVSAIAASDKLEETLANDR